MRTENASALCLEFIQRTGFPLKLLAPTLFSGRTESLRPSEKLQDRFGEFAITVFADEAEMNQLWGARWDEAAGVWWQNVPDDGPGPRQWAAVRNFDNVEVRWWTTSKTLDSRWHDLIAIVQAAVEPSDLPT